MDACHLVCLARKTEFARTERKSPVRTVQTLEGSEIIAITSVRSPPAKPVRHARRVR